MTAVTAEQVAAMVRQTRFGHLNESELQQALARQIATRWPSVRREVRIGAGERIDLLIGRLGIEVKVGGGVEAVRRQLVRYAKTGAVDELLLVTTRAAHASRLQGLYDNDVTVTTVVPAWM